MLRKKAVLYARQSSGKEEESESIAMQLEHCRRLAEKCNLEIIGEFSDANCSGRLYPDGAETIIELDIAYCKWRENNTLEKKSRSGLRQALNLLPNADMLVVYDMTRLYRPVQNSFLQNYIDALLVESNVHLLTIKEGESNPSDFSDSLVTTIKSYVNDNQIKLTAEKSRIAMQKLKDEGFLPTGAKMYGIRYIGGKNRKVEVVPKEAEVIKFVFEQTLKYRPYNWIIREINEKYLNYIKGKVFYASTFRHIISQPFYCGYIYDSHGSLVESKQMAGQEIVSYDEWRRANEIVNGKHRHVQRRKMFMHPFSGLLICGYCGSRMLVGLDGNKEFYHCITALHRGSEECCKARVTMNLIRESKNYTGLRRAITPLLVLSLHKSIEDLLSVNERAKELPQLKRLLTDYEKRLAEACDGYISGKLGLEAYHLVELKINSRIKELRNQILQIENASENIKLHKERFTDFFLHIDDLMQDKLEDHVFEELLLSSIQCIKCYYHHIEIKTVYGNFTLMRYMDGKFRHFPHFTYDIIPSDNADREFAMPTLIINYTYEKDANKKLIADFGMMKIYSQGDMRS